MLQRKIVLVLFILIIFSCTTTNKDQASDKSPLELYFQGTIVKRWNKGLSILLDKPNPKYFGDLFFLYLNTRYEPIKEQLEVVIWEYLNEFECDFNLVLDEIDSEEDVRSVLNLSRRWEDRDKFDLIKTIFSSPGSSLKSYGLEYIGREVLTLEEVVTIYDSNDKGVRIGAIGSVGYIHGNLSLNWLVERLLDSDEEISAAAIFALSKHGDKGFTLIADNIQNLSLRIKLSAIDLLTFNKVERVLLHYSALVLEGDTLLRSSILKSYRSFGRKADLYIIDLITKVDADLKLELMDILASREYNAHLGKLLDLIDDSDIQSQIIALYYEKDAKELIKAVMMKDDLSLTAKVVERALELKSDIIFYDIDLSNMSLLYLLDYVDQQVSLEYFESIGYDDKYIADFLLIDSIYRSLNIVTRFELLNGEEEFVTIFFELEQKKALEEKHKDDFYLGLEMWLDTKDDKYLDESIEVKKSGNPKNINSDKEMDDFINSLSYDNRRVIEEYNQAKIRIIYDYRKLTYRLKSFGEDLVTGMGYSRLIR